MRGKPDHVLQPQVLQQFLPVGLRGLVIAGLLVDFYRSVRPFGLWGPIRAVSALRRDELDAPTESPVLAIINVVLGMTAVTGLYLSPMHFVGHIEIQTLLR